MKNVHSKGQGPTGASTQLHRVWSNSRKAIEKRQKAAKAEFAVLNLHAMDRKTPHNRMMKMAKFQKAVQVVNDMTRDPTEELCHTLIKNGTQPVRHEMMSRQKARNLNIANKRLGIDFYWLLGKQNIPKKD